MKIIDTHAHLDEILDIDSALVRAYQSGVRAVMAPGVDGKSSKKNFELSQRQQDGWPKIYVAVGMHPSQANENDLNDCIAFISHQAMSIKAVGEIGLDFWYPWVKKSEEKKELQRYVFKRQLELARQLDFPVIIHSRGAWQECLETVLAIGNQKVLFHWYSGPVDIFKKILDKGFFVSATPALSYSAHAKEAIEQAPLEQLLIETDSPVVFKRLKEDGMGEEFRAEPKDVFVTLEAVSFLKKKEKQIVLQKVNENAKYFFNLDLEEIR